MKSRVLLSGMLVTALLCGCSDDIIDNNNKVVPNPVKEGNEIIFGTSLSDDASSLEGNPSTRTVYGDRTPTGVPVYWDPNGDEVAIFCLQTSQPESHLVNYLVKPQEGNNANLSASVERLGDIGLQWGKEDEHRFYAFYPASAVKGSDEENQTGMITANIPVTQMPTSWRKGTLNGATTYFGVPNMDYAYMYAFTSQKKSETPEGTPIDLHFKNLVTVIDITVQGPESGSITVTNVNVSAVDGANVILTGDFTCNIRGAQDNSEEVTAECTAAGDLEEVRNTVSIPCYNRETGEFIVLNAGQQLNVKAYIIPDDDESHIIKPRQLQVTVATLNGAAKRKTLHKADVVPHKINRVLLPHLEAGGTNYWMSNLDPDIYVTELSLPGSKMSLLTADNRSDIVYQNATIEQQLQDGVRAFIFHTQRRYNGEIFLSVNGESLSLSLSDGLAQIAEFLNTAEDNGKKETAFVLVTYSSGGSGSENAWMSSLQSTINTCANNPSYRIFNGNLSPNTTLDDVANKIIVKANYNSTDMIAGVGTAPMLYTIWEYPYVEGGLPMTWSNPNGAKAFTWLYQEVTSVLDTDRNENKDYRAEATEAQKRQYIENIFQKSVEAYKNNTAHDIWFMNDLGGYYTYQTEITGPFGGHWGWEDHNDPVTLAQDMNNLGVQLLQNRTENAGLGLVYMNFADRDANSGQQYRSDWLIQTIIDNNFKFALRKKGDASSQQFNATYTNGGNAIGWD